MSDIERQLAEALYCAFWKGEPKIPTEQAVLLAATKHFDSEAPIDAAWRALAAEALRHMEWARRHTTHVVTDLTTEGKRTTIKCDPLTLPPEGWEP